MTFTPKKPAVKIEDQILVDFMELFDSGRLDTAGLSLGQIQSLKVNIIFLLVILILVQIQSSYKCT